ncbi:MAG: hypothetical protein PHV30_01985 [Candidatus Margulisbacteria bacterium]|nr:hypothetical protein [Candidatus Margulisiibacteriota bacterium]
MDIQLQSLIDKIKADGVQEAEKQAQEIILTAREDADKIIRDAESRKILLIEEAQSQAIKLKETGEEALKQTARDIILNLKDNLIKMFDVVLNKQIAEQLTPSVMKDMILKIAEHFQNKGVIDMEVVLNSKDKDALEKLLYQEVKKDLSKGLTIKVSDKFQHGFRIGKKGNNSYYDFTAESLTEIFKDFVNPKISKIL